MSGPAAPPTPTKKAADIDVLRCLNPDCRWMLAYEVTAGNILTPDLHWTARQDGATRYFPCPSCGGRNVVEEVRDAKGALRHAVTGFAPTPEGGDDLTLMPRSVRDKLDRVGIKLHLKEWALLSLDERRRLVDAPCDAPADVVRYAAAVDELVRARAGKPPDRLPPRGNG